jgi:glycosyltransferase involved in cell wall biosynthesis
MKIALVTETYPPEVNGVARSLHHVVTGMRSRGHHVEVLRPRQAAERNGRGSPPRDERIVAGLPLPGYPGLRFGLPAGRRLRRHWQRRRPDVVQVETEGPLGWTALRAARRLGIPVASSFHTNFHVYCGHYGYGLLGAIALRYLRAFHNRTRCTFVPSHSILEQLRTAGFRNLGIVGRGVDTRLFDPAKRDEALRREWGADERTPVVIYVGRLAPEKNLDLVVEAFQAVRHVRDDARLVLVGDGPSQEALKRRHADFHFAGVRVGEDLARHYASGDLFVFPSLTETFGNVVTEALASGLLVLAYGYAAAAEHIETSRNGWTVPVGDRDAFLSTATELAHGELIRSGLREQARATAQRLSWEAVVAGFERQLLDLIAVGKDGGTGETDRERAKR